MTDIYTESKRSQIMSRIRSTGTKPEVRLAAIVEALVDERWHTDSNARDLPGTPDVVIRELEGIGSVRNLTELDVLKAVFQYTLEALPHDSMVINQQNSVRLHPLARLPACEIPGGSRLEPAFPRRVSRLC